MIKNSDLASSTLQVMILTLFGFLFGIVVQIITAYYFGATKEVDAFVIATIIPQLVYGFTNAVLMTSLMVILVKYIAQHGEKKTWQFASNVLNISTITLFIISIVVFLSASFLAKILAPGFDLERQVLTIKLIKILSIAVFFYGLSSFTTGVLYAKKEFVAPALFKVFVSGGIITSILLLGNQLKIFSLAWGTVIGLGSAVLLQLLTLVKYKMRYYPVLQFKNEGIKKLLCLSFPLMIASFFFYVNKYVNQIIASTLQQGSVAIINYAFLLISFPVLFFGGAIGTVLFPSLTKYAAKKGISKFNTLLTKAIRLIFFILVPITVLLIILGHKLIKLLFEHGMFQAKDTTATSLVLICYSFGLVFFGLDNIVGYVFYAFEKMKIRSFLVSMMIILNILFSLLLVKPFAESGLAMAVTLSYIIIIPISFLIIHYTICRLDYRKILISLTKIIIVSSLMGITLFCIRNFFSIENNRLYGLLFFFVLILLAFGLYCSLAELLGCKEVHFLKKISKKFILYKC